MKQKKYYIIGTMIFSAIFMSLVDSVIQPHYMIKSLIKLILFLVIPIIYFTINKKESYEFRGLFLADRKSIFKSLCFGIMVYGFIVVGYLTFKNFVDVQRISSQLTSDAGIDAKNFVFVAIYISFINSLLEEIFFRGYGFMILKKESSRGFAYLFSSFLFAIYHLGMTINWFHPIILILVLLGLVFSGCIFNYMNEKFGNIYVSWIIHMFANFGINTVGFIIFGIIAS